MKNPTTETEWYEAVNAAAFFLLVNDCQLYGLITGPKVDVKRCEEILEQGRNQKIPILPLKPEELIRRYVRDRITGPRDRR